LRRARWLGPVAALAVAALLSGCGGGGDAQAQEPAATSAALQVVTPSPAPAAPASSPVAAAATTKHPAKHAGTAKAAPAEDTVMLTIKSFTFMPMAINLHVGQTLVVTNLDEAAHTITASDGSFDSGRLEKGQSFRFRPTKPGTYDYYCDFHQYMTGTIEVS
jgi:plastocyanin